jgi:hypothetical protein
MFHFGELRETVDSRGRVRIHGECSLHVQAPWRIVVSGQVAVGYRDMRDPPDGVPAEEFDPNEAPRTRRDELLDELLSDAGSRSWIARRCSATDFGDIRIFFDADAVLEVFPDSTASDDEYWRLLAPDGGHIVMEATGMISLPPVG